MKPYPGEDVQPFEQDLPGENEIGFNTTFISNEMPLEMAQTMNGSWGFNLIDDQFKSTKDLIQTLVGAAGRNSNYLMNTGPMPDGRIQDENIQTYKEMGAWFKIYGESIYGTRGGPIGPRPWGVTTQKDNVLYVHVMDWQDDKLILPIKNMKIARAVLLKNGQDVDFESGGDRVILTLTKQTHKEWDTVIKITME